MADGIFQMQFFLVEKDHDRSGSGNRFGQRSQIKQGIHRHGRLMGLFHAATVGFAKTDLCVPEDQYDRPGKSALIDCFLYHCIDPRQFRGVQPDFMRKYLGQTGKRWFCGMEKPATVQGENGSEKKSGVLHGWLTKSYCILSEYIHVDQKLQILD